MSAVMELGSNQCPHPVGDRETAHCGVVTGSKAQAFGVAGEKVVDQGCNILWAGKDSGDRVANVFGCGGRQGGPKTVLGVFGGCYE
jgi:hypothetical protein